MKSYPVKISPELEVQIRDVLMSLDIQPVDIKQVITDYFFFSSLSFSLIFTTYSYPLLIVYV